MGVHWLGWYLNSQEAEEAAAAKAAKLEERANAAAAAEAAAAAAEAAANNPDNMAKSPSDFSCHSYESFVGEEKGNDDNNKEKMSIRSEGLESVSEMQRPTAPTAYSAASKVRKVSTVSIAYVLLRPLCAIEMWVDLASVSMLHVAVVYFEISLKVMVWTVAAMGKSNPCNLMETIWYIYQKLINFLSLKLRINNQLIWVVHIIFFQQN